MWCLFTSLPRGEIIERVFGDFFCAGIMQTALCASLVRAIGHQWRLYRADQRLLMSEVGLLPKGKPGKGSGAG